MTAILVLCTIALFLIVDYLRTRSREVPARRRATIAPGLIPQRIEAPAGLFFGPGHTWARVETDGSATVGIDDFAGRLMGRVDRLDVARQGANLHLDDAAFVVHQGEKSAAFAAPFEGVVTEVNAALLADPDRLHRDPYESSWLVRIRPKNLSASLHTLRVGEEAQSWMRNELARLRDFFARQLPADAAGATLQDGGTPVENLLEHLSQETWERFEEEFLVS